MYIVPGVEEAMGSNLLSVDIAGSHLSTRVNQRYLGPAKVLVIRRKRCKLEEMTRKRRKDSATLQLENGCWR